MSTTAMRTRTGTVAVGALAAAAIAAAGLGSAPNAGATCFSVFGIGGGANCSSRLTTVAIAIGQGAVAHADGIAGAALSLGVDARAAAGRGFTFAVAAGNSAIAASDGYFSAATTLGRNTVAGTGGAAQEVPGFFNVAVNFAPINGVIYPVVARGIGNVAVNLLGVNNTVQLHPQIEAIGFANIAANIGGLGNRVVAEGKLGTATNIAGRNNNVHVDLGFFNSAFNVIGGHNAVDAGPGPFAVAGTILQSGKTIEKQKPGININGFRLPNTAAAVDAKAPKASATSSRAPHASAAKRVAVKSAGGKV